MKKGPIWRFLVFWRPSCLFGILIMDLLFHTINQFGFGCSTVRSICFLFSFYFVFMYIRLSVLSAIFLLFRRFY